MSQPLQLPDLGITIKPGGTLQDAATLDLGWFGDKAISWADVDALEMWIDQLRKETNHERT
jgi:hypothetical protein